MFRTETPSNTWVYRCKSSIKMQGKNEKLIAVAMKDTIQELYSLGGSAESVALACVKLYELQNKIDSYEQVFKTMGKAIKTE